MDGETVATIEVGDLALVCADRREHPEAPFTFYPTHTHTSRREFPVPHLEAITIHGQRYRLAAEIKIIDNGPGIPDAIRDTLFYPMITGKEGGTGLGLSIAQNLIDQHKGRIDCISWPGHTEFTIYLPLRK